MSIKVFINFEHKQQIYTKTFYLGTALSVSETVKQKPTGKKRRKNTSGIYPQNIKKEEMETPTLLIYHI